MALQMKVLSLLAQKGGTAKGKAAAEIKAVWRWIKRRI